MPKIFKTLKVVVQVLKKKKILQRKVNKVPSPESPSPLSSWKIKTWVFKLQTLSFPTPSFFYLYKLKKNL